MYHSCDEEKKRVDSRVEIKYNPDEEEIRPILSRQIPYISLSRDNRRQAMFRATNVAVLRHVDRRARYPHFRIAEHPRSQ